jgi:hypothetical protein
MNLPETATARWQIPADVLRGVPPAASRLNPSGKRLWPWLALLALAILAYDWIVYGRSVGAATSTASEAPPEGPPGLSLGLGSEVREPEEVAR